MIVLGSTGSIGVNSLNIAKKFEIEIEALVAGNNIDLLNEQIKEHNPKFVCVAQKSDKKIYHKNIFYGIDGILEILNLSKSTIVINAIVGFNGLIPTIEAIKLDKKVALANKESLVVAGSLIDKSKIFPIDSEHFGLWYLLQNKNIEKMIITASGGAFRDTPLEKLKNVSIKEALNHPNWSMGKKITIDSATMANKLYEILEAYWLFKIENLDALIETKSIIHAIIDFQDGSSTAHIANCDMKLPIAFAIFEKLNEKIVPNVNLAEVGSLEFRKIETTRYPLWEIKDYIIKHPQMGLVLNASNEIAVDNFLNEKIPFLEISNLVKKALREFENISFNSIHEIQLIDDEVRKYTKGLIS
ncbi:MAG: 1-deoxy-D-xylulose-5-phosphate reductoisomerase [Campylobacterales bacterium]|nr:1-deoxy-D-xylulose-5-phosphate reductoisomerase [Campylobacterales bacterium]